MKNKKLAIGMATALALVMVLTGTFAWFMTTDYVKNHFSTGSGYAGGKSLTVFEIFEGGDNWKPGDIRVKDVAVANDDEIDALVRLSFEEVLEKLSGSVQKVSAKYAGLPAIPQLVNVANYTTGDWTGTTGYAVSGLPAGVTLRMLETEKTVGTSTVKVFNFFLYAPITVAGEFNGENQKVTAKVQIDSVAKTIAVSNVEYYQYSGRTTTEAAWADFIDPQTSAAPAVRPAANIGFAALDATNKYIKINYTDDAALNQANPADADGKWWYNTRDGFFYYIGKVAGGSVTSSIMSSIELDSAAGNDYGNLDFDLIVNMEGLQNSLDAVKDVWGLDATLDAALIAALTPYFA